MISVLVCVYICTTRVHIQQHIIVSSPRPSVTRLAALNTLLCVWHICVTDECVCVWFPSTKITHLYHPVIKSTHTLNTAEQNTVNVVQHDSPFIMNRTPHTQKTKQPPALRSTTARTHFTFLPEHGTVLSRREASARAHIHKMKRTVQARRTHSNSDGSSGSGNDEHIPLARAFAWRDCVVVSRL